MNFKDGEYKFFSNNKFKLSNLLKYISLDYYDLSKLKDVQSIVNDTLNKYKVYTDMSDERISAITNGIKHRIDYLIEPK